jgi:hypothetical protein
MSQRPARRVAGRRRAAPVTWDSVRAIMQRFPGAVEGTSYGTPAFHVRRKFLLRLREDDETLAVRCDFEERDARMAAAPKAFFITEHYRAYPAVCVRLSAVKESDLRAVLEQAWRREAGKRLVAEFDAQG